MAKCKLHKLELVVSLKLIFEPVVVIWTSHQVIGAAHKGDIHTIDAAEVIFWRGVGAVGLLVGFRRLEVEFSEATIVQKLVEMMNLAEARA